MVVARRAQELEEVMKSAEETEDEEEIEEENLLGWGHSRNRFYGADEQRQVRELILSGFCFKQGNGHRRMIIEKT